MVDPLSAAVDIYQSIPSFAERQKAVLDVANARQLLENRFLDSIRKRQEIEGYVPEREKFETGKQRTRTQNLLGTLTAIMSDPNISETTRNHLKEMGEYYVKSMPREAQLQLDAIFTIQYNNPAEKKAEEYRSIRGPAPERPLDDVGNPLEWTGTNEQLIAEYAVKSREYEYERKAYMAGGKENLPMLAEPRMTVAATRTDLVSGTEAKDVTQRSYLLAYRDPMTNAITAVDSKADFPGDLINGAVDAGYPLSKILMTGFAPEKDWVKGNIVTVGNEQFVARVGTDLVTGDTIVHKEKIGLSPNTSTESIKPDAWTRKVADQINADIGEDDMKENKVWKQRWVALTTEAHIPKEGIKTIKGVPQVKIVDKNNNPTDWYRRYIKYQQDFFAFSGTHIPVVMSERVTEDVPWEIDWLNDYEFELGGMGLVPTDGLMMINVNGNPISLNYKAKYRGKRDIWYDSFGFEKYELTGNSPGSNVIVREEE